MMDPYVALAKKTIEQYSREKKVFHPAESAYPGEMFSQRAGVFVSIHKNGELRGCIGTIAPTKRTMAEEIVSNAIAASTRDPRFLPVGEEELSELTIHVDVLGETERIDSEKELDARRYGVIVEQGCRRGLLLPDLEGVDSVEKQVAIAKMKAGIPEEDTAVCLYRFVVIRHE